MSNLVRWRDDHHMLPLVMAASFVLVVAIGAAVLWARDAGMPADERLASQSQMQAPFEQVKVGQTSQPELVKLGFDAARYKTRTLSGLGVQEYFMPKTTTEFDAMDPALRSCFEARTQPAVSNAEAMSRSVPMTATFSGSPGRPSSSSVRFGASARAGKCS